MKIFICSIVFAILVHYVLAKQIDAKNVVVAINCGSEDSFRDSYGVLYQEDKYFSDGVTSDYGAQFQWRGQDATPYMTERYHSGDFSYNIPLRGDSKYVLILTFSEVYFTRPGQKIFNVDLGKQRIITDLDVFERVGQFVPYEEFIPFELRSGNIYINDRIANGAYNKGEIVINFKQGRIDNPKINAIRIVRGGLTDTHYEEFKQGLESINKIKEERDQNQRELELNQRRETERQFEDEEEAFESAEAAKGEHNAQQTIMQNLLNIPYLLELSAIGFVVLFILILKKLNAPAANVKDD